MIRVEEEHRSVKVNNVSHLILSHLVQRITEIRSEKEPPKSICLRCFKSKASCLKEGTEIKAQIMDMTATDT